MRGGADTVTVKYGCVVYVLGNSEVIGEQDDQVLAEMPVPEADVPAGQEAEVGEAAAPAAQQAAVVPHQQDHDYSRQRAQGEGAEPAPQQNGGRVQEGYDDDTEDEDGGRLGRLEERARPSIDEMIRQLQQEQDERILAEGGALPLASPPPPAADAVPEAREGEVLRAALLLAPPECSDCQEDVCCECRSGGNHNLYSLLPMIYFRVKMMLCNISLP